jgi:hypothetical protein
MSEEPTISYQDLFQAVNIIDLAAKRGAFHGKELSVIGSLRDRIEEFLSSKNKSLLPFFYLRKPGTC